MPLPEAGLSRLDLFVVDQVVVEPAAAAGHVRGPPQAALGAATGDRRQEDAVKQEQLLRIAAAYHGLLGIVMVLLPGDLFRFLGIEPPRHWLLYYLVASAPLVAAFACELARRRPVLRPGLALGLAAGNVAVMAVVVFFVCWSGLAWPVLGTGVAAGLWAWLLWGAVRPAATGAASPSAAPPPPAASPVPPETGAATGGTSSPVSPSDLEHDAG